MDLALADAASRDPPGSLAKPRPKPALGTHLCRAGRQHRGKACAWWTASDYALSWVQCRELHLHGVVISNRESRQNIPVRTREGSGCPRYWSSPDSCCLKSDDNLTSICTVVFDVSLLSPWIFLLSAVSLSFSPSHLPFRKPALWQLPSRTRNLYLSMHYDNYNVISIHVQKVRKVANPANPFFVLSLLF